MPVRKGDPTQQILPKLSWQRLACLPCRSAEAKEKQKAEPPTDRDSRNCTNCTRGAFTPAADPAQKVEKMQAGKKNDPSAKTPAQLGNDVPHAADTLHHLHCPSVTAAGGGNVAGGD